MKIIEKYITCRDKRFESLIGDIKLICYSNENIQQKIKMISDSLLTFIYKILIDVQKEEKSCKILKEV